MLEKLGNQGITASTSERCLLHYGTCTSRTTSLLPPAVRLDVGYESEAAFSRAFRC
jgi:hypothetical protein